MGAAVLAGSAVPSFSATAPASVVASTGMIADTAREIGGSLVEVQGLMGPGVDPHAYRQTRSDIVSMARADLVLWHGLYLEAQMEDFFGDLSKSRNVVAVAEGLPKDVLLAHDVYAEKVDPHVWMDPGIWPLVARNIATALIEVLPDHTDQIQENLDTYLAKLLRLDAYANETLASIPETSRVLLTAHDAFAYFGAAFGFEVIGIQGISTESEAGLNRISELSGLLVERDIRAVFVESSVSDRNIRAVIEGAEARGHSVSIGGELYSDAMGVEGTYEGTYLGMIDHNVTTIAGALGGEVPDRGMDGKLNAGT